MRLRPLNPDELAHFKGVSPEALIGDRPMRIMNHDWSDYIGDLVIDEKGLHIVFYDPGSAAMALDEDMHYWDWPKVEGVGFGQMTLPLPYFTASRIIARHLPWRVKWEFLKELGFEDEEQLYGSGWVPLPPSILREKSMEVEEPQHD